MLTDTHAHLYWDSFQSDFDEVLNRAKSAGVKTIINVGVDLETSQKALDQLKEIKQRGIECFSTIGIHPHEAIKYLPSTPHTSSPDSDESIHKHIKKLGEIYQSNPSKVVGVGECGLDFFFTEGIVPTRSEDVLIRSSSERSDFDEQGENVKQPQQYSIIQNDIKSLQIKLLLAQKDLAKKLNLPLIIHIRDDRSQNPENSECWDEAIDLLKDYFGIFHCYSGLPTTTHHLLSTTNFLISFAAPITYPKNDFLREAAKIIPLDRIVLETDCPFLPPQSSRGQRNEPKTVLEIAQLIADLKGVSLEKVSNQTTQNAKKIFKI